jgi:hypothetical protein
MHDVAARGERRRSSHYCHAGGHETTININLTMKKSPTGSANAKRVATKKVTGKASTKGANSSKVSTKERQSHKSVKAGAGAGD